MKVVVLTELKTLKNKEECQGGADISLILCSNLVTSSWETNEMNLELVTGNINGIMV